MREEVFARDTMDSASVMKILGAGIWWTLHQNAKAGDRIGILRILKTLPCIECRKHADSYFQQHPFPKSDDGLFEWSVKFHNHANQELGKSTMTLEEAEKLYSSTCTTCTSETNPNKQKEPTQNYIQPLVLESRSGPKSILKQTTIQPKKIRSRNGR